MIKNEYEDCKINYPVSWFNLDCYVKINDVNIDVEYDGWYWHQDIRKDIKRDKIIYLNKLISTCFPSFKYITVS